MRLRGGTMAMLHNVKTVEKAAFQFPLLLFYFSLGEESSPGNCHAPLQIRNMAIVYKASLVAVQTFT